TPEALMELLERELPGIAEAMRAYGQNRTHYSMLSRSFAGVRGQTLIVCFPGSKKGVAESLDAVFPAVLHAFKMIWGGTYARHEYGEDE
ncbi:bifunctional molybdenum cofactor biosynthesis protein MoaC/MoaB, partial [bacterium]|nr:bifunctional molybdenum cofactor biosynthesis protein MoaC/MoaB [bacterium]